MGHGSVSRFCMSPLLKPVRNVFCRVLVWKLANPRLLVAFALAALGCGVESPPNAFLSAVTRNDLRTVESLLNQGAVDVNYRTPGIGDNALGNASSQNEVEMAMLLLRRGADPNIATEENFTPLLSAAYHGHTEMVRLLIRAGANVNAAETRYGFTPLASAAQYGHAETVELLLDAGADPTVRVKNGMTAMRLARDHGRTDVVKILMADRPRSTP